MQLQQQVMVAFRAGEHSRALRMGSNALALDPSNRVLQEFVQLLSTMVDDESGTSTSGCVLCIFVAFWNCEVLTWRAPVQT